MSIKYYNSIQDTLREKAKKLQKTIVLAEGCDVRHIEAASILMKDETMKNIILLGDEDKIRSEAKTGGFKLTDKVCVVDPKKDPNKDKYTAKLFEARSKKGMTEEQARKLIEDETIYAGAAMVATGDADGMVGGAVYSTGEVIRATLFLIGLKPGLKTLSSFFLMEHPDRSFFHNGVFIFSDCGVVPNPTAEQLSDITISAVASYRALIGDDPRVALLSFSTKGSAKDASLDKVIEAKKILDSKNADFIYDGEIQFDAAILPNVAAKKCPDSPLKGNANIFIFPDLNAGNICYKVTERLAKCSATGPLLQGAAKPVNDLSRGCSSADIVGAAIITALQTQI